MVKRDGTTLQCLVCGDIVHQAAAAGDDGEVELVAGAVSPPPDAEQEVRASSDLPDDDRPRSTDQSGRAGVVRGCRLADFLLELSAPSRAPQ